ncbi:MAG: hypothetical protein CL808_06855 [Citromicrobium sp.]|nr:hypothetical protein [Citromicrobium sp.]
MEFIAPFVFFAIILVMATLGAVLLVFFVWPDAGLRARTAYAAMLGPGIVLTPLLLFMFEGGEEVIFGALGMAIVAAACALVVGWPVSHVATRRLARATMIDVSTFE